MLAIFWDLFRCVGWALRRLAWELIENGYTRPWIERHVEWLGGAVQGDIGTSTRFREPVAEVLWPRVTLTAILMFWVMIVMVPAALPVLTIAIYGMGYISRMTRA